jgi:hypothetical protein
MGMNGMNIKTEDGDFPAASYPTQRHAQAQAQGEKWLDALRARTWWAVVAGDV